MPEKLKGVKHTRAKLADGTVKTYYFHRATGTRLPDDPNSAEFKQWLERLNRETVEARTREPEKTISWLIRAYCNASDWTGLANSTREIEAFNLKAIEAEFGDMPLSAVEERGARGMFLEWRDEIAQAHPRAADAKLARLARVLSFGLDREHLLVNPLATFKRAYRGDRSEIIWLPQHIETFSGAASDRMNLAMVLGLHTGQRQGDIRALRWSNYDGEALTLTQSKTGMRVYIPCTSALKITLDELPRTSDHILTTRRNRPWKRTNFSSAWDRAYEASGLTEDLHYHDLRGTAVTMLAEAGCNVPEIATITGHSLESVNKILERYLSRTKALARSAIAKLETRMKTDK